AVVGEERIGQGRVDARPTTRELLREPSFESDAGVLRERPLPGHEGDFCRVALLYEDPLQPHAAPRDEHPRTECHQQRRCAGHPGQYSTGTRSKSIFATGSSASKRSPRWSREAAVVMSERSSATSCRLRRGPGSSSHSARMSSYDWFLAQ